MKFKTVFSALIISLTISSSFAISQNLIVGTGGGTEPGSQGDGVTLTWAKSFLPADCQDIILFGKWSGDSFEGIGLTDAEMDLYFDVTQGGSGSNVNAFIEWNFGTSGLGLFAVMGSQSSDLNMYLVEDGKHVVGEGTVDAPGNGRGWSHISFFGKQVGANVPDSGSPLILLGLGLGFLAFLKHKK